MVDDYEEHIERLARLRPYCREAITDFRLMLEIAHGSLPRPPEHRLDNAEISLRMKRGIPIYSRREPPFDLTGCAEALIKILAHRVGRVSGDKNSHECTRPCAMDLSSAISILRGCLSNDAALPVHCESQGISREGLAYLAQLSTVPAWHMARQSLADAVTQGWEEPYCPVCGSDPAVSFISKAGRRFLHCRLCGMDWPFSRLKCPFCGNSRNDEMGYLQSESEEAYRIDYCERCRRYIKTVDTRSLETVAPMELEDLSTIHLDFAAAKQGFKGPAL